MNLIIFDINNKFINEAKRLEKYGITVINTDVNNLIQNYNVIAVISPANSFGFMDGGIDKVYMDIFPNIQNTVQNKLSMFNIKDKNGRNYFPIGSAITVQTHNNKCPYLISAPTMFMPGSITNTDNVHAAFLAILYVASNNPNVTIACPGLGTGVGQMNPKDVIDQMELAITNYSYIFKNEKYIRNILYKDTSNIVMKGLH